MAFMSDGAYKINKKDYDDWYEELVYEFEEKFPEGTDEDFQKYYSDNFESMIKRLGKKEQLQ